MVISSDSPAPAGADLAEDYTQKEGENQGFAQSLM
jgi:hypothetical protein